MLDTDTVSFALRDHGQVVARIVEHRQSELCVSAITVAELRFGADRRKAPKLHRLIDGFTGDVAVMPFDEACATQFGRIASELAERGTPIGDIDVMIAAHAITLEVTLVTNNTKHFSRVPELKVENWV
jgi:tRNA(fMet)-specific endonuclease VapC